MGAKGERTRERILDAALELFSENGSNAVSIRAVAVRAGISHSGLLRYFRGKDDLVVAALQRRDIISATSVTQREHPDPGVVLRSFLEATERNTRAPHVVALLAKMSAEATESDHPAHDHFASRYQTLCRTLATALEAVLPAERRDEAVELARGMVALSDGLQLQWLLAPDAVDTPGFIRSYLLQAGVPAEVLQP